MAKAKKTVGPFRSPEGRLSFPHLRTPETTGNFPSGKYVTQFLIPKTADVQYLVDACVKCAQQEWPSAGIVHPTQVRLPFADGDSRPTTQGHWVIKAKSKTAPLIVGPDKQTYTGEIKGGDFARLGILCWPWPQNLEPEMANALKQAGKIILEKRNEDGSIVMYRPAVTFLLDAVQFIRAGAALGGMNGSSVATFEAEVVPGAPGSLFDAE